MTPCFVPSLLVHSIAIMIFVLSPDIEHRRRHTMDLLHLFTRYQPWCCSTSNLTLSASAMLCTFCTCSTDIYYDVYILTSHLILSASPAMLLTFCTRSSDINHDVVHLRTWYWPPVSCCGPYTLISSLFTRYQSSWCSSNSHWKLSALWREPWC